MLLSYVVFDVRAPAPKNRRLLRNANGYLHRVSYVARLFGVLLAVLAHRLFAVARRGASHRRMSKTLDHDVLHRIVCSCIRRRHTMRYVCTSVIMDVSAAYMGHTHTHTHSPSDRHRHTHTHTRMHFMLAPVKVVVLFR